MLNTSFSPWPSYTDEEADAVRRVLLSNRVNYWTGQECREFEKEFSNLTESEFSVAVSNGTVALELALKALGISVGDEVVVSPRTFVASASSIVSVGATPIFADVDPESQNICAATIEPVITSRTKVIIAVHLAGWPCEMDDILALANKHGLYVIEDCAQAHGAKYKGRSVGSIGHIGCWSFCQDKIMTTGGEGGMVTTNDRELWSKIWSYKDHGKSWEAVHESEHLAGFRWLHESFGTNGRMTEMQAAIGRIQIKRLPDWHKLRTQNAKQIAEVCKRFKCLWVPGIPDNIEHAHYKYYVFVKPDKLKDGWNRDRIVNEITSLGVPCFQGSCSEVYLEKAFENSGVRPTERLPVAKQLGDTSLMFLVHPTLKNEELKKTCCAIRKILEQASN